MERATMLKCMGWLLLASCPALAYTVAPEPITPPPGSYHTSWIGNSFGGSGGDAANPNGSGYWVQDNAGSMAVSPDGTVFLGSYWDEAGRTIGLYKNGRPGRVVPEALNSTINVWGFNTANTALCVDGGNFYVATKPGPRQPRVGLLHFQWTPGDPNSARYVDETDLPRAAASLSCGGGKITVAYPDAIETFAEAGLRRVARFPVQNLAFALAAPDGGFWVIAAGKVRRLAAGGGDLREILSGIGDPTALAWAQNGQLIVTDNGPAQQVLFFDVSGAPRLASRFGDKGGLYSGTPGAVAPLKLFALRGAGMDAQGNLYVAMSFSDNPSGNTFLRAFSPAGALLWEDDATSFVDGFAFEPGSNGSTVFGRTTRWQLDLGKQAPGTEASLRAITLDPLRYPDDPRIAQGMAVDPRLIAGTQLLYGNTQRGTGYTIFVQTPGSEIFHQVAQTPQQGVAWFVTDDGDIWHGDAAGRQIALYRLQSIGQGGVPLYDWNRPRLWPWPADFQSVTRVIYDKRSDSLYVFGYLTGQKPESFGVVGDAGRRYDHWMTGHPVLRWRNDSLPLSPNGLGPWKALTPKDVALAGHYLFMPLVRSLNRRVKVPVLDADTGRYVGTLVAGPEIGAVGGDVDLYGAVHATQTAQGEYLILVEDDWRAKNILFRWKP